MRKNEKWDFLDEKRETQEISEADLDIFDMLSADRNEYIRDEAATVLYYSDSPRAEQILLRMLNDKSADVRSSACDSLNISNSVDTIETLKLYALSDTDMLVRGYALFSITDIALRLNLISEDIITFFEQGLRRESEPWVKAAYYYALYMAGKTEYLLILLEGLHSEEHIRCMTAHLLSEAANGRNADMIMKALNERLKLEDPKMLSVISSIEIAKQEIEQRVFKTT